jgi:hypothetical protein
MCGLLVVARAQGPESATWPRASAGQDGSAASVGEAVASVNTCKAIGGPEQAQPPDAWRPYTLLVALGQGIPGSRDRVSPASLQPSALK